MAGPSLKSLNDLAVLQVKRPLQITPAPYQGPVASHTLGAAQPEYTATNPCPLRNAGLELAQPQEAHVASSLGWMSEYGEKELKRVLNCKIMMDTDGWYEYDGPLDSGGSGGPLFSADGRVLAINSRSEKLSGSNGANIYRSYARSVSKLTPPHGLQL